MLCITSKLKPQRQSCLIRLLSLTALAVASHSCAVASLLHMPASVFTTCCNLTDVANTNSPRAHDPFTPHPPHTFQQEWLGSRDVVTLGTNCAHKEHHSEKCDLMNTKLPDEFRDITLPAAYVLQHTESPLAVMFSGTVAILTNALHV